MTKLLYEEYKQIVEARADDDQWFFGEGWRLIHEYPEYADQMVAESLRRGRLAKNDPES